jgi:hypothetical protein
MDSKTWIGSRLAFLIIIGSSLSSLCLPMARAVSPAPDGGYAGNNTAEGTSALFSLTSGIDNTALGFEALYHNSTGRYNSGIGYLALFRNTTGTLNSATGVNALTSNTTGSYNTANGTNALYSNNGSYNTANGYAALFYNTSGSDNTATGDAALFRNTTGVQNTATGVNALITNTTGSYNTANGTNALYSNTNSYNTADGFEALYNNTSGFDNTGVGDEVLFNNSVGLSNTAIGGEALYSNSGASDNTAVGRDALRNSDAEGNTAVGSQALYNNTTGAHNTALGYSAGLNLTIGGNNIDIGYNVTGVAGESNTIRIGDTDVTDTYIRGISGVTISGGAAVYVNSNGKLGTMTSSARFKDEIQPMDKASEAILSLKPVTFRYKKELNPTRIAQFGLVAEDVEKVNPDLVARDKQGKAYTVRYEAINAMLLNEFLKEHQRVLEQQGTIAQLEKNLKMVSAQQQRAIEQLSAEVTEQASLIQKVSAQLVAARLSPDKSEGQVALNR